MRRAGLLQQAVPHPDHRIHDPGERRRRTSCSGRSTATRSTTPSTNSRWASVLGCDAVGGAGSCSSQGSAGAGNNIFRIRHDVDFLLAAVGTQRFGGAAKPDLSPCAILRGETRFGNPTPICPKRHAEPVRERRHRLSHGGVRDLQPDPPRDHGPDRQEVGRYSAPPDGAIKTIDVNGQRGDLGPVPLPVRRQPRRASRCRR